MKRFASDVIAWHARDGRRGLPWQGSGDPYRIWLSEIMLQQTQVAAVIPYYERFLARFPTVDALARASENQVLSLWSGLGYYARGRNLLEAAREIRSRGAFPQSAEGLAALPGVGRSTAAAIAAFAYGERAAILDGNVKRVLARCFGVEGWPGNKTVEKQLWTLAEQLLPQRDIRVYTQAMMDLGATVCTRAKPRCEACPVRKQCVARREQRVAELPAARPAKALPTRSAHWLVLQQGRQILLERRPSSGLWGGLLAFPELQGRTAASACAELGYDAGPPRRLPTLEHGFTHFRLKAYPVLCHVKAGPRSRSKRHAWVPLGPEVGTLALPAPVRRLLERLEAKR